MFKVLLAIISALMILSPPAALATDKTCGFVKNWYYHQHNYPHVAYATTIGMIYSGPIKLRGVCRATGAATLDAARMHAIADCEKFARKRNGDRRHCKVVMSK